MSEKTLHKDSILDFLTNTNQNIGQTERIASTVAGGALLAFGIKQGGTVGAVLSVLGGGLALRGVTGHCQVYDALNVDTNRKGDNASPFSNGLLSSKIHVTKSLTINKEAAELYAFWRNLSNLPQFMQHLESVTQIDDKRSHWVAKAPLGLTVEWDAEITSERENERLGWKSSEGASVPNSGVVEFLPTADRGTEVKVTLTYEPPAGKVGATVAKLFGEEPSQQVYGDLYRFKSLMESGELITTEGQSSGRAAKA